MSGLAWWEYLTVPLTTGAVAVVLTPIALRLALRWNVLDRPGAIKSQENPVPYLGGVAIVVTFAIVIAAAATIKRPVGGTGNLLTVLGLAVALSVLGLIDDIRGLGAWVRLVFEAVAALAVLTTGTRAHLVSRLLFGHRILDDLLTVLWIVGVTNAFNFLDNMDGLSAGVAGIASLGLFVVAYLNGQFLVAVMALALVGCAAGFLRHNFHPAKIYMGDAGALFLGFLLGALSLRLRTNPATRISFFVPVLVLGVALFDTTLVTISRIVHHRSPFSGGRDHTSHRLVLVGIPVRVTVSLIYGVAAALSWLAIVMTRLDRATALLLIGLVAAIALFIGGLLGRVPVYETSRRRKFMIREVISHEPEPLIPPGHAPNTPTLESAAPEEGTG
ncbi:MAG TPA: hypothetical protein VE990_08330 [Acidimicrobiales bacterium]|nr:hypothetical protein [Acidimicrobiales bacterium]